MKKYVVLLSLLIQNSLFCTAKTGREIIAENGFKPSVEPMLTTCWSQDGGENSMLPLVKDDIRAYTGCGATAVAQIMKYWEHPSQGIGCNYYYWEGYAGHEQVFFADFQNTYYEWENMISVYKGKDATQQQIDAVSTLMAHIGVALEMKYLYNEKYHRPTTGTQIEYIHTVMKKFFGYNHNMRLVRYINGAYSMDEWLAMVYKELSEGRPVLMGGTNASGNSHIFVADGYDENGNIHLNMGHANDAENKYYDITRTDQTYTIDMRMILGISPEELDGELTNVNVSVAGSLAEALGGELNSRRICRLKLTGTINNDDVAWLKELAKKTTGQLSYLDLSECTIEGNTLAEAAFDGCYTLQEIILPNNLERIKSKAFRECHGLYAVHFPDNLLAIEDFAFSGCRYLESVCIPSSVKAIGYNPFRYDKLHTLTIGEDNLSYAISNSALTSKDGKILYSMPVLTTGEYKVSDGVETINKQAFMKSCAIERLLLPSSLRQIDDNAFYQCYSLTEIYSYAYSAPTLQKNSFDNFITASCVLHVPQGSADNYKQRGWDVFTTIIDDLPNTSSLSHPITFTDTSHHSESFNISGFPVKNPTRRQICVIKYSNGKVQKIIQ